MFSVPAPSLVKAKPKVEPLSCNVALVLAGWSNVSPLVEELPKTSNTVGLKVTLPLTVMP